MHTKKMEFIKPCMNKKIIKTIELIKKSYAQPIIFNTLINNLSYLMDTCKPLYEIKDDWSKILIYCVTPNRIPNQGLDSKILNLLKKMRNEKLEDESNLKLLIILYYMKNRNLKYLNHLIVFELISNYMGINDFYDGLILSIFCSAINANLYGFEQNKKYRDDTICHLLNTIKNYNLSSLNIYIALPLFIQYDVPYAINDLDIQNDFATFCKLEALCFYAKYSKDETKLKELMPKDDIFIKAFSEYINKIFVIQQEHFKCNLRLEDRSIFYKIEDAYSKSIDRQKFKNDLLEFITNL